VGRTSGSEPLVSGVRCDARDSLSCSAPRLLDIPAIRSGGSGQNPRQDGCVAAPARIAASERHDVVRVASSDDVVRTAERQEPARKADDRLARRVNRDGAPALDHAAGYRGPSVPTSVTDPGRRVGARPDRRRWPAGGREMKVDSLREEIRSAAARVPWKHPTRSGLAGEDALVVYAWSRRGLGRALRLADFMDHAA